ncbi:MAG: DNA polymerase III subunit delta [Actinobacteria bacterium]|nr:DNA polymerase III subunit delta [Actinomycetota bacterium]
MTTPVVLITGDEEVLVGEAVRAAVEAALGDEDRSLALEELGESHYRLEQDGNDFSTSRLLDAARTPAFLTSRRVVVGRHLGRFGTKDDVAPLVALLEEGLTDTRLVLVWERGVDPKQQKLNQVPKSLKEAVVAAGGRVQACSVGRGRDADTWLRSRLDAAAVSLDGKARALIAERMGEDRTRVVGLLETLTAVFGPGTRVGAGDVAPYLGDSGQVPQWELTDAIDAGDVGKSIDRLHRMLHAGGRHPLGILATLHGHYGRLLRLDGAGIADEQGVTDVLGIKGFSAKKALTVSRRMGSERIGRSIKLLSDADLDLKGRTAWPSELVAEVLVARLASMNRR